MGNRLILLTAGEFARAIGVSITTVEKWDEQGILRPYLKTPTGRRKYLPSQVDDYFAKYGTKSEK